MLFHRLRDVRCFHDEQCIRDERFVRDEPRAYLHYG